MTTIQHPHGSPVGAVRGLVKGHPVRVTRRVHNGACDGEKLVIRARELPGEKTKGCRVAGPDCRRFQGLPPWRDARQVDHGQDRLRIRLGLREGVIFEYKFLNFFWSLHIIVSDAMKVEMCR